MLCVGSGFEFEKQQGKIMCNRCSAMRKLQELVERDDDGAERVVYTFPEHTPEPGGKGPAPKPRGDGGRRWSVPRG